MNNPIDVKQEKQVLEACMEVGKLLTSTLDLKEILKVIVIKVSQLIEAENWSLLLQDEQTGELSFDIVVGLESKLLENVRLSPGEGIAGQVLATGEPQVLQDVATHTNFNKKVDELTGFSTRSVICFPLKTQGKVLGVLEIINVKDITDFQSRYYPVLKTLTDYAAIAIQNSKYCERIFKLSITDEYTGLYNARFLYQCLEKLTTEDSDRDRQFAVIFVDIDNFKEVVDTYGHLKGSQVLSEIGTTLSACMDPDDILIKYGGDEYVLILLDKDRRQAIINVEKMLAVIRKTPYLKTDSEPVHVTASFGIAMYPDDAVSSKELLIRADQVMYSVKRSTKDGYGITEY